MTWFTSSLNSHRLHRQIARYPFGLIRLSFLLFLAGVHLTSGAQGLVRGHVLDAATGKPIPDVHIALKKINKGTRSLANGAFSLPLPKEVRDTLTFSSVGYEAVNLPIQIGRDGSPLTIKMQPQIVHLKEVNVAGSKPVEKKFGIKNRNPLIHFTDGMFLKSDTFEIGQLIKLGPHPAQITSVRLYINAPRKDSASFRINFYRLEKEHPTGRILEKSIQQRHPIQEGWLTFDLRAHKIFLQGDFVAAIEFISPKEPSSTTPISYEIKLGGRSRSFYRKRSLGPWNTPPHHYCLYVTALVDPSAPEPAEDPETPPLLSYPSKWVQDTFAIFVRLPAGYHRKSTQRFPVLYHLDANAYFDPISASVERLAKQKKLRIEPIVVGIGYGNAALMDSLRVRDYTYPPARPGDSLPLSGGGERFYQFLRDELIPEIEKRYRVDTSNRALMGHSFGGYFTLFALGKRLADGPFFHHFVAASPSLFYQDNYILEQLASTANGGQDREGSKLFLSMGELELSDEGHGSPSFGTFVEQLRKHSRLRVEAKVYRHLEHMGTAIPSFEAGIDYIWGK